MADKDEFKILGFTKREAEVLIMSLQVLRPNPSATNGCTARAADLVRIGTFENAETARSQFAALRARVMALPNLPKPTPQTQNAITADDRGEEDDDDGDDGENDGENKNNEKPSPFLTIRKGTKPASTRLGASSEDYKQRPNPFLLTEEECKQAGAQAGIQPPTLPPTQPAARYSTQPATQPGTQPGAGSEADEGERPAKKRQLGEGAVDEDILTVQEWEAMGDDKAV